MRTSFLSRHAVMPLQVEAGGEGAKELLHVLQRSATGAESSVVGVLGFEGTGKKSLLKALRREQAAGSSGPVPKTGAI